MADSWLFWPIPLIFSLHNVQWPQDPVLNQEEKGIEYFSEATSSEIKNFLWDTSAFEMSDKWEILPNSLFFLVKGWYSYIAYKSLNFDSPEQHFLPSKQYIEKNLNV